jgi:hypothetical protein
MFEVWQLLNVCISFGRNSFTTSWGLASFAKLVGFLTDLGWPGKLLFIIMPEKYLYLKKTIRKK